MIKKSRLSNLQLNKHKTILWGIISITVTSIVAKTYHFLLFQNHDLNNLQYDELIFQRQSFGALPFIIGVPIEYFYILGFVLTIIIPIIWLILSIKKSQPAVLIGFAILSFSPLLFQSLYSPLTLLSISFILLSLIFTKLLLPFLLLSSWIFPPYVIISISLLIYYRKAKLLFFILALMILRFNEFHYWFINRAYYTEMGFTSRINELRGYFISDYQFTGSSLVAKIIFNKLTWFVWTFPPRILAGFDTYWWYGISRFDFDFTIKNLPRFLLPELSILLLGFYKQILVNKWRIFLIFTIISLPVAIPLRMQPAREFLIFLPIYATLCSWGWTIINQKFLRLLLIFIWLYWLFAHYYVFFNHPIL